MATDRKSFLDMYDAFCSRSNAKQTFICTLDKVTSECNFDSVKSCLAIGAGDGVYEIAFLEKCTTNVTKFIAVEEDHDSVERLKVNLMKRRPNIDAVVHETNFHCWKGPDDPVDLIQMFHVLYSPYHKPGERLSLLRKAHDHWLVTGGFLAVLSAGRSSSTSAGPTFELFGRLGTPATSWAELEPDILEAGFVRQYVHEIPIMRDFTNPDEPLLRFYQNYVDQPVALDDVRRAMKELYPGNEPIHGFHTVIVFQKAL